MKEIKKSERTYIREWFSEEQEFTKEDTLVFDMPPFCSGDYSAKIYLDNDGDPYIDEDEDYSDGCREMFVVKNYKSNW
jgi:hypothetical protein